MIIHKFSTRISYDLHHMLQYSDVKDVMHQSISQGQTLPSLFLPSLSLLLPLSILLFVLAYHDLPGLIIIQILPSTTLVQAVVLGLVWSVPGLY